MREEPSCGDSDVAENFSMIARNYHISWVLNMGCIGQIVDVVGVLFTCTKLYFSSQHRGETLL